MFNPAKWHSDLRTGHLAAELDTASGTEVFSFINVISTVLNEENFREATSGRIRRILRELLDNVAQHVEKKTAYISINISKEYLRYISIDVYDTGPGLPKDILDKSMLRLMEGEREHGLLLISRLASSFRFDPDQTDAPKYRGSVGCDVIEFNRPPLLTKRKDIGQICLHYTSPTVLWVGRDDSYVDFGQARIRAVPSPFERAIARAVKEKWLPVLRLYFGEISEATYILFEKTGRDVPSIAAGPGGPEGFKGTVRSAMEIFLENHFREQRVVFLAHRTMSPQDIEYWARDWDCPFFTSREDCERYLNEL